jgi:hypothetical protein
MSIFRVTVVLYFVKIVQKCNIIHDFKNELNAGCMVKRGGGLFIFYFCIQKEGCIGEGLKREGAKYRNYSTSIPSSPFPNMLQERGQLQRLKHGLQG